MLMNTQYILLNENKFKKQSFTTIIHTKLTINCILNAYKVYNY